MKKVRIPEFSMECEEYTLSRIYETRVENKIFNGDRTEDDLDGTEFFECRFDHVVFEGSLYRISCIDVVFEHCEFNNVDFSKSMFRRVTFSHCRMMGCNMSECSLKDVTIEDCQGRYINFSGSKCEDVIFKNDGFKDGAFNMMTLKNIQIGNCDLTNTEWIDTNMMGLDVSDSEISGILLDPLRLKGIIVNEYQAVEMAKLLGLIIK